MKVRFSALRKFSPLALYCGVMAFLTSAPAMATEVDQGGVLSLQSVSGAIQDVIALTQGPVAKLVAVTAIIGGAIAFAQGREVNEGMKNLGIVALVIGLLIGATSLLSNIGAGI